MAGVTIYQRARRSIASDLSARGYNVVYRANEYNRCPGCGRAHWYIGRLTAECGFCATAVPLADTQWSGGGRADARTVAAKAARAPVAPREAATAEANAVEGVDKRRHERIDAAGRILALLIDGAPHGFAVHNISASGLMGDDPVGLAAQSTVQVRFEGGILVPAQVRWVRGALTGLAFSAPVLLDLSRRD